MKILFYMGLFFSPIILAQSIALDEPMSKPEPAMKPIKQSELVPKKRPVSYTLSYVEFRDAKILNVLKLIQMQSGLQCSNQKELQTDLSLKLENVSWNELLKIVCNQATP